MVCWTLGARGERASCEAGTLHCNLCFVSNEHSFMSRDRRTIDRLDGSCFIVSVCLFVGGQLGLPFKSNYNDCEDMMWSKFQSCRSFNLANLHINAPSALKMSMSVVSQLIQQQWRVESIQSRIWPRFKSLFPMQRSCQADYLPQSAQGGAYPQP